MYGTKIVIDQHPFGKLTCEKKDTAIVFTFKSRIQQSCILYLELYKIPESMNIIIDNLDDLWDLILRSNNLNVVGNVLKIGFLLNNKEKEITFYLNQFNPDSEYKKEIERLKIEIQQKDQKYEKIYLQYINQKNRREMVQENFEVLKEENHLRKQALEAQNKNLKGQLNVKKEEHKLNNWLFSQKGKQNQNGGEIKGLQQLINGKMPFGVEKGINQANKGLFEPINGQSLFESAKLNQI